MQMALPQYDCLFHKFFYYFFFKSRVLVRTLYYNEWNGGIGRLGSHEYLMQQHACLFASFHLLELLQKKRDFFM